MKISRRSVLRASGAAAALLALSGCSAAGSAALGSGVPDWVKKLVCGDAASAASSEAASAAAGEAAASSVGAAASEAAPALAAYDANVLTGEAGSGTGRIVGVMVNNISNSQRQNARPQRGIGSADILVESKVEGGITRLCALFHDVGQIPEIGPLRSGRDQFLQLLMPWQALYYHDGESIFCTQFVNVYGYSGLNIGGKSYFNTPTHPIVSHRNNRGREVAYEHTEFTSGKEICKAASDAKISLYAPSEGTIFHFASISRSALPMPRWGRAFWRWELAMLFTITATGRLLVLRSAPVRMSASYSGKAGTRGSPSGGGVTAMSLAASDEAAVSPFFARPLSRPGSLPPSAALPAAEQPVRASAAAASPEI